MNNTNVENIVGADNVSEHIVRGLSALRIGDLYDYDNIPTDEGKRIILSPTEENM